ncbi:MAG: FAD-binding and (Fe-S)-binding domain-containing protein [Planctomycetota bacterium]|jgi:FAD/FMN-containing dehydrogenase/Fe-S oxidoreductase
MHEDTTTTPDTLGPDDRSSGLQRLSDSLGGQLRTSRHDRLLYATDASLYQVEPRAVVIPESLDDVAASAAWCLETRTPLLMRGGGTSLAGQTTSDAIVLDTSAHLNTIDHLAPEYRSAWVEPGIVLDTLNTQLKRHDLFFAPDVATASHATIGGMIANNSAGARSVRYGMTGDHVRALDVILLNGDSPHRTIVSSDPAQRDPLLVNLAQEVARIVESVRAHIRERYPAILRHVDAYALDKILDQLDAGTRPGELDLVPLLVGSEGTLAITLRAQLKLTPLPRVRTLAICSFETLEDALSHVTDILTIDPSAVEVLDDILIELASHNDEHRANVEILPEIDGTTPGAALYVELSEDDHNDTNAKLARFRHLLGDTPLRICSSDDETTRAWALRKAGEPLLHNMPGNRVPLTFVEDTAVAPEKLPAFVERFKQICAHHNTTAAFFAHASVGCLHIRPLLDPSDAKDRDRMVAIARDITNLVIEFDGALSGEHGDGRVRTPLLEQLLGPEIMDACRQIKRLFDPLNLLNPGNIVEQRPADTIATRLRVLPQERARSIDPTQTFFEYAHDGGPLEAAAQCNGAGFCRRTDAGSMCPSYRALRDERHTTRGRANALRIVLSGQHDLSARPDWDDPDTHETLSLCLSCKSCARECPSNVDIATLKSEYLAQSRRGKPWRAIRPSISSQFRLPYQLGAIAPRLATAIAHSHTFRSLVHPLMGFTTERKIPPFNRSLRSRLREHRQRNSQDAPRVGILYDCTTAFSDSDIGMASVRVLEAFGYHVTLVDVGCCERPAISAGLLGQASRRIPKMIRKLESAVQQHNLQTLLSLEPSCYSSIADDWLRLRTSASEHEKRWVTSRVQLIEEFLARNWDDHPSHPHIHQPLGQIVHHHHCHQRALHGPESALALLEKACPGRLKPIDRGCCGLAGMFGFEKQTYELSKQIARVGPLDDIRRAHDSDFVVTSGASCRTQFLDLAGRRSIHPMQLLDQLIAGKTHP